MRQYFSPPPSLRLHELSPNDVRKFRDDLLLDVDPERLAQRLFTESDSPAINHIVIPKRPRTSPIDPTHGMRSNFALVEPLLLSPGSRTPVSVETFRSSLFVLMSRGGVVTAGTSDFVCCLGFEGHRTPGDSREGNRILGVAIVTPVTRTMDVAQPSLFPE